MLGSYLDEELEPSKVIEIDEHLAGCEICREELQLLHAMRGSLRRVVRTPSPGGLRDRIGAAMIAERSREEARAASEALELGAGSFGSWRSMVPLATAAAIALMWGAATNTRPTASETHAGFGDDLLAEIVAEHSQPLPPEVTKPEAVRGLERWVGVPLPRLGNFERAGAHLLGGRVLPLHTERAAMLQYVVGTGDNARRVSVLVYDAQKLQVGVANLAPRAVGTTEVRVGREKGYSVAATQRAGEGYLVASDLNPDETAQFAAMVYDDR
jgi:anti-sigma factor RsiW